MIKRIAVYPGTFDPITLGHVDIIKRTIALVDHLIIAVASNTTKKPLFSPEMRTEMVMKEVELINSDKLTVKSFTGLLIDLAAEYEANLLIRGLRAVSDFEYEFKMSWINHKLDNKIETVFLPASENTQFISSNFVKEVAKLGGDIGHFVSPHVTEALRNVNWGDK